jgi:hypothetical protein
VKALKCVAPSPCGPAFLGLRIRGQGEGEVIQGGMRVATPPSSLLEILLSPVALKAERGLGGEAGTRWSI